MAEFCAWAVGSLCNQRSHCFFVAHAEFQEAVFAPAKFWWQIFSGKDFQPLVESSVVVLSSEISCVLPTVNMFSWTMSINL